MACKTQAKAYPLVKSAVNPRTTAEQDKHAERAEQPKQREKLEKPLRSDQTRQPRVDVSHRETSA